MTDIRFEIYATEEQAALRKVALEGDGYTRVLIERTECIAVDRRGVGGQEDSITATAPIWALVAFRD